MTENQVEQAVSVLLATPYTEDEAGGPSHAVFGAVDALIAALHSDDVAPTLLKAVHDGRVTVDRAAAYMEIAMWSGTDNGAASSKTMQQWLEHPDDRIAVELALVHMATTSCILSPKSHRERVLRMAGMRLPELEPQCRAVAQQWARISDEG